MDLGRLGQYVLEEHLADGGMAEVFLARREGVASFSRQVCIKRIFPHLARKPSFRSLFLDEATTQSKLEHRNIVQIQDLGEEDGQLYLAMEFVNGVDLRKLEKRLQAGGAVMPVDVGVFIAHELLTGLWVAHSALDPRGKPRGIVHRDVCPHNVLLSFSGEVKLADFGIARADQQLHQTQGDVARGRHGYMPMEQYGTQGFDARADLYAVGVTLFEMFAGRHPFGAGEPEATLHSVMAAQAMNARAPLASARPDLPPTLLALIEQLLAQSPDDRPADADAAREVLRALPQLANGADTLATLMAQLYPGLLSVAATPRQSIQLLLPAAPSRASLPPSAPSDGTVDPYAATSLRPSTPPRSDEESAPPLTTDARPAIEPSSASGARVPAWTIALAAAVLMAGTALTISRSRGHANATTPIAGAPTTTASPPVTTLHVALPPSVTPDVAAPSAALEAQLASDPPIRPSRTPAERAPVANTHAVTAPPTVEPAPRAHPAVTTGAVRVVAVPWGEVFIDGTSRGRSPVTVSVTTGEHLVRITGGVEHSERVVVTAGATQTVFAEAQ